MVKKEVWKGSDDEALGKMSMDDFVKRTTSRERRTLQRALKNKNKGLKKLMEKVRETKKENPKKLIRTHIRYAVILPEWLGLTFGVYNGKEYKIHPLTHQVKR